MSPRPPNPTLFPYTTLFRSLDLLGENPFPSGPPRYVRLVYYKYRFSTPTERARGGAWWQRERMGYLTEPRSEEHTSELQSHSDLVCRLLLEKKKNTREAQTH